MEARKIPDPHPLKIVIADDHNILRETFRAGLIGDPDIYVIDIVDNAQSIEPLLLSQSIDVLLLDIKMPGGPVFLARRWLEAYSELRVVFMTGYDFMSNVYLNLLRGCSGLVSKRDGMIDMIHAIKNGTPQAPYFSPSFAHLEDFFRENRQKPTLTPREIEILSLIGRGLRTRDVSQLLNVSVKTIENHKQNMMIKLGINSQVDLAVIAHKLGLD